MDNIHEIASDGAEMPRFDDGMVNLSELLRIMAESLVNEIVDARADEACEAGNQGNGYRERRLTTSAGTINPRIPKLCAGSCFPEDLIERCSCVDRELERRSRVVRVFPSRKSLIRMMGAVFAETDEDWAGRRWFNNDSIGRAVEGAEANAPVHACEGTAAERAARIIAPVVADNPVAGGKAA